MELHGYDEVLAEKFIDFEVENTNLSDFWQFFWLDHLYVVFWGVCWCGISKFRAEIKNSYRDLKNAEKIIKIGPRSSKNQRFPRWNFLKTTSTVRGEFELPFKIYN